MFGGNIWAIFGRNYVRVVDFKPHSNNLIIIIQISVKNITSETRTRKTNSRFHRLQTDLVVKIKILTPRFSQ